MKSDSNLVRVELRQGVNLEDLTAAMNSARAACGSAGSSIARQVISGEGVAEVDLSLIQLATDTQDGVEAVFDHFVLSDPQTLVPLFQSLVRERLAR